MTTYVLAYLLTHSPRKPSAPSMGCLVPQGLEASLATSLAASLAASLSGGG